MTTYACASCDRRVDPDLEPSPGGPRRCPDCSARAEAEFSEWLAGWKP